MCLLFCWGRLEKILDVPSGPRESSGYSRASFSPFPSLPCPHFTSSLPPEAIPLLSSCTYSMTVAHPLLASPPHLPGTVKNIYSWPSSRLGPQAFFHKTTHQTINLSKFFLIFLKVHSSSLCINWEIPFYNLKNGNINILLLHTIAKKISWCLALQPHLSNL